MKKGHIVERGKHKYLVRWRRRNETTGKSEQVSKMIAGDYAAALVFLANQLNPKEAVPQPVTRRFNDYMENEWAQYQRDHWNEGSTVITQGSFIRRHILPFFGEMLLSNIKPKHISEFQTAMEKKGLSKARFLF